MQVEYEATFTNINKDEIRERLKKVGALLVKPETLMKRITFSPPLEIKGGWMRVRDEGDRITMSLKIVDGDKIEDQKETCLVIDNFDNGVTLFRTIGCKEKSYQETKREIWKLDGVEICLDEWPFLEPFVEVEGKNEEEVKVVSEKIGFDYNKAKFCAVGTLYEEKYNIPSEKINNRTPRITFEENPFSK